VVGLEVDERRIERRSRTGAVQSVELDAVPLLSPREARLCYTTLFDFDSRGAKTGGRAT